MIDNKIKQLFCTQVKSILFHLREYLLTSNVERRQVILCTIYEDYSDVNQLIEKVEGNEYSMISCVLIIRVDGNLSLDESQGFHDS